jgi:hypothetical protein
VHGHVVRQRSVMRAASQLQSPIPPTVPHSAHCVPPPYHWLAGCIYEHTNCLIPQAYGRFHPGICLSSPAPDCVSAATGGLCPVRRAILRGRAEGCPFRIVKVSAITVKRAIEARRGFLTSWGLHRKRDCEIIHRLWLSRP